MKETPTPRTDALLQTYPNTSILLNQQVDIASFARQLERELAEANKKAAWLVPARNSVVEACVILPNVAEYIFQLEKERDEWRTCTEKLVEFSNPRVSHVIEYWEILNKFNKLKGKQ
jgi:hypothetical protein